MFKEFSRLNPDIKELNRPNKYTQLNFTVELIKDLACLDPNLTVPLYESKKKSDPDGHIVVPVRASTSRNCVRCWHLEKVERKSRMVCRFCDKPLCCNNKRNCLLDEHPLSDM